jgi:hypothetical protein
MMAALLLRCSPVEVIRMKPTWLLALVPLCMVLGLVFASPALAGGGHGKGYGPPDKSSGGWGDRHTHGNVRGKGKGYGHHKHSPSGHVPELDPGLVGSAAVLLIGGTLVLHGRRRVETEA